MSDHKAVIHRSSVGTYHPAPCTQPIAHDYHGSCDGAWTINDTRGYLDGGPSCDECGACECSPDMHTCLAEPDNDVECIGLSFAYVCLDGGDSLCEDCAKDVVEIVPCDCEAQS